MMFVQIASMIVISALALPQDSKTPPPQGGKPQPGAQGGTQQPGAQGGTQQPGAQGGTQPGAQGDKTRAEQARHNLLLQRSDKLIGMSIQDKTQGNIGVIDDVILTPTGQISHVVVSGTDPNNQTKLYSVPWNQMNLGPATQAGQPGGAAVPSNTGTERALLNIERDRLIAGPSFDRANWTKTSADREYWSQVDSYYGGGAVRGDTTGRPMDAGANTGMSPLRGSQLRNQAVVDAQGNTIGNISTVAFDPSGSRINYVALTLTNPGSGGARTIAVPWEALKASRPQADASGRPATGGTTQFMMGTPMEKLQGAPEFQTGDASWRQMSDQKWVGDLYTYYGVTPYWNKTGMNDGSKKMPHDGKPQDGTGTPEPKQPR